MVTYRVKWLRVSFGMIDLTETKISADDLGTFITSLTNDACIILKVAPV
jgi:hypothetical protein